MAGCSKYHQQPVVIRQMMLRIAAFLALAHFICPDAQEARPHAYSPVSIQRSKDCPQGGRLVGKQCVETQVIAPLATCPSGTTLRNDQCISVVLPRLVCPEGFERKDRQCSRATGMPLAYACDEGDLDGTRCRKIRQRPAVCPQGFELRDSHCVRLLPFQKVCPSGYELFGKECSSISTFSATPVCPADFTLTADGQCSRSITVAPRCSNGFQFHREICTQAVSRVPAACPSGFTVIGTTCRRTQETPSKYTCSEGFALVPGNQCVKEIPVPPTCPPGTVRGRSGVCQRVMAKVPQCGTDEELVNGQCQSKAFFVSDLRCPTGYTVVHGKCKRVTDIAPTLRCAAGALDGTSCVKKFHSVPSLQCQEGYRLAKGPSCIREVAYDCSKPASQTECEMPEFVSELTGQVNSASGYKSKQIGKDIVAHSKAEPKAVESKTPRCTTAARSLPETCIRTESVPVSHTCPAGSKLEGTQCTAITTTPAQPYCATGQMDSATGRCITIDVVPSTRFCAVGTLQPDGNCLETRTRAAAFVCPEGSHLDEVGKDCITTHHELVHPNKVVQVTATPFCEVGSLVGNVCRETQSIPRKSVCPHGSEQIGAECIVSRPPIYSPPIVVTRTPQHTCPEGTVPTGANLCRKRDVVPADHVCGPAGVPYNGRCEHTAPLIAQEPQVLYHAARPYCPAGELVAGARCITRDIQAALLECGPGFSLVEKEEACLQYHERVSICPPGTETTTSGCIKKVSSPPQVTEIKVCTKGQPNC